MPEEKQEKTKLEELQEFRKKYLNERGELKAEYITAFKGLETSGLYEFLTVFLISMEDKYLRDLLDISKNVDTLGSEQVVNIAVKSSAKAEVAKEIRSYLVAWLHDANVLLDAKAKKEKEEEEEEKKGGTSDGRGKKEK
jgi:hypothetical protein